MNAVCLILLVARLLIGALLLRRLMFDGIAVRRGEIPATRLAVPLLLLAAALLVANGVVPRPVATAGLFAIDLAFFATCFMLVGAIGRSSAAGVPPEEHLEQAFLRFFPVWFARLAATDIIVLSHALVGLRGFLTSLPVDPYSYVNGSKLVVAGAVVAAAVIPDGVLFWLLLPHRLWWLALVLDILDVWAFLWLFGLYGTMIRRPHTITSAGIVLRNGILARVDVDPSLITTVRNLGILKRYQLPPEEGRAFAALTFGGVPIVEIQTCEKVPVHHQLLPGRRAVDRIFVASDAPEILCRELEALARGRRTSNALNGPPT